LTGTLDVVLYETTIPGELQGKEVIDADAKKIGVVRGVRVRFPPLRVLIIIRGKDFETEVPIESIEKIGKNVIKLRSKIDLEEVTPEEVITLIRELKHELLTEIKLLNEDNI